MQSVVAVSHPTRKQLMKRLDCLPDCLLACLLDSLTKFTFSAYCSVLADIRTCQDTDARCRTIKHAQKQNVMQLLGVCNVV